MTNHSRSDTSDFTPTIRPGFAYTGQGTGRTLSRLPRPVFAPETGSGSGGDYGSGEAEGASSSDGDAMDILYGETEAQASDGDHPDDLNMQENDAGGEGSKDEADDLSLDQVPQDGSYDFSHLDLPDGMELDSTLAELAAPEMADVGMTQRQANAMAGVIAKTRQQQTEAWVKTNQD